MKFSTLLTNAPIQVATLSLGVSILAGCGPQAGQFTILPTGQSTYQGNVANNKVDVLFVVDNSGTMQPKQDLLKTEFNSFASVFNTKGFDYRMAVVTTDTTGELGKFQAQSPDGGATAAIKVITSSTANAVGHFNANVNVGIGGGTSAAAKPLHAINLALGSALLATDNANFLRSEAHLAIIIVSDADDSDSVFEGTTPASTLTFLENLKPDVFDVISRTYKNNYTVSAVAVNDVNEADCLIQYDYTGDAVADPVPYENGDKYKTLINATNGSLASICATNFSSGLAQISQRIAEAITEIPLARVPNQATISVTFNGNAVPQNGTHGWTYSSTGNKIVFHGDYIPNDNTTIGINYTPNDIIR